MNVLLFIGFLALLFIAAIAAKKGRGPSAGGEVSFEARKDLFSPAERSFYGVLEQAVAGEFKIIGKVRLGDLIQPVKGLTRSRSTSLRNRVQQKHVDFVLCHPETLAVVGVVELDDASHGRKDRADRDDFVDRALASAGVPMLHFPARKGYVVVEIRERLGTTLGLKVGGASEQKLSEFVMGENPPAAVEPDWVIGDANFVLGSAAVLNEGVVVPAEEEKVAASLSVPNCPACNIPMVKRQAKKGANSGQWFWACTEFPKCRKVFALG